MGLRSSTCDPRDHHSAILTCNSLTRNTLLILLRSLQFSDLYLRSSCDPRDPQLCDPHDPQLCDPRDPQPAILTFLTNSRPAILAILTYISHIIQWPAFLAILNLRSSHFSLLRSSRSSPRWPAILASLTFVRLRSLTHNAQRSTRNPHIYDPHNPHIYRSMLSNSPETIR
jgi:hypothetical protein